MREVQTRPESLAQEALQSYQSGDLQAAIEQFTAARAAYAGEGDGLKEAEMANNLAVALLKAGRPQEAYDALEATPEVFQEAGAAKLEAQAYGNLGSALEALGDAAGAERSYSHAAQIFEKLGADEELGYTLQAISRLQLQRGRPFEALASMQVAVASSSKPRFIKRALGTILNLPRRLLNR